MEVQKQLESLFGESLKNKKVLKLLETTMIESNNFQFAVEVRKLENIYFPKTEEEEFVHKEAKEIELAFRMVNLNVPLKECWLIKNTVVDYIKKGGQFALSDASDLISKTNKYFD